MLSAVGVFTSDHETSLETWEAKQEKPTDSFIFFISSKSIETRARNLTEEKSVEEGRK